MPASLVGFFALSLGERNGCSYIYVMMIKQNKTNNMNKDQTKTWSLVPPAAARLMLKQMIEKTSDELQSFKESVNRELIAHGRRAPIKDNYAIGYWMGRVEAAQQQIKYYEGLLKGETK